MGSDNSKQAAKPPPAPPTKARVFSSSPTKAQVKLKQLLAALAAQTGQKEWTKKECEAFEHTLGDPAARPLDKLAAGTKMASQGQAEFASVLEDFNDRLNKLNKKTKNPNGAIPVPMKFRTEVQELMKELNGYTHEVESFCGPLDQVLDKCDEVFKAKGKDRDFNLWISHVQMVLELMHEKVEYLVEGKANDLHSKFEELEKVLNFEIEEKSEQAEVLREKAKNWNGWKRAWAAGTLLVRSLFHLAAGILLVRSWFHLQTTVDQLQEVKEVMGAVDKGSEAGGVDSDGFAKGGLKTDKTHLKATINNARATHEKVALSWDDPSVKEIQAQLDFIRQRNKIIILLNNCLREMNNRFEYY